MATVKPIKKLFLLWKDLLSEGKDTQADTWVRKKEDIWAVQVREKVSGGRPKLESVKPVREIRPEPKPEPVEKVSASTVDRRIKSIEAALKRLTTNYTDGLLAEPVYKDLRAKYTEELKKLKDF